MAVNVALFMLHWKIGKKVNEAIESKNRSERYGQEIVASLVRQLSTDYGTAFSEKNIQKKKTPPKGGVFSRKLVFVY
jgi:hypothetical protein